MAAMVIPLKVSGEISLSELFIGFGLFKFSKLNVLFSGSSNNLAGYFIDLCPDLLSHVSGKQFKSKISCIHTKIQEATESLFSFL
jgi:hypothetical protein